MIREVEEIDKLNSDEFKGLKKNKEELLPGSYNLDAIKGVQSFLNKEGFADNKGDALRVDGIYGANTANAVMKYQRANGLGVDGIVGDETWNSIYNKKKKREENKNFEEGLKSKSGGFFYDKIQTIRKAQRNLGIDTGEEVDDESNSEEDFHDRVRRRWETGSSGKNTDVWKAPKSEKFSDKPGKGQEMRERKRPDREQMPWEAISEIEGRNIPNKPGEPWREKMPDVQAKPWQRNTPKARRQTPGGRYVPDTIRGKWRNYSFPEGFGASRQNVAARYGDGYDYALKNTGVAIEEFSGKQKHEYGYLDKATGYVKEKAREAKEYIETKAEKAKDFLDKTQIAKNKDYREHYNFEEKDAKVILTEVFDNAMDIAAKNQDMFAQASINSTREKIKNFDEKSIVTAYYLNDSDGAGTFGHAGVLLVNKDGKGILFSYYPQNADDYTSLVTDYSDSEMRIEVFDHLGIEKLLSGESITVPSTSGEKRTENYNRYTKFHIGTDNGKAMFEQAVAIAGVSPEYNVVLHNCDHMALSILWAGKIVIDKDLFPNNTYRGSEGIDV